MAFTKRPAFNIIPTWLAPLLAEPKRALPELSTGLMMAVLVIPQSLGYALLAGLPPVMGLYSAIVPTMVYAYVGSSSVNAVGPVAITAIMTSGALSSYALGGLQYQAMAVTLALMVGVLLMLAHVIRLGWIMQFVSRGVASGFISGASVLIILGQLKHLIGTPLAGDGLIDMMGKMAGQERLFHAPTAMLGLGALGLLFMNRYRPTLMHGVLYRLLPKSAHAHIARFFIVVLVGISIIIARQYDFANLGIATLAPLPTHLPLPAFPVVSLDIIITLLPSALLIALIAFISSASVAGNLARIRHEPFAPNHELKGLGLANIASSLFGGFAVSGGISRTSMNVALGANTPLSSMVCAIGVLIIALFLGQFITGLPYAVLSAVIIASAIAMIDVASFRVAHAQDKSEALTLAMTFVACVGFGLNIGLITGLLVSFALIIYRSYRVHMAVVGQVEGSEHFRNIHRHDVQTFDNMILIRIDESLYFGNVATVRTALDDICREYPTARHIVVIMTAVNHVDLSAQEMLADFNRTLIMDDKQLHFTEIKEPVMDALMHTPVITALSGQVFLSTGMAVNTLKNT
ncbi:SulP family inorganic anion transporter [Moraxella equi]|uniref:Sulfate transporter n=1 Tax=Moraxella equi TaxID=60442 RepID=A0A378QU41_9GAMM|nr:SulP family inorganic anion transporter [Moraxella equi]OPH39550.1 sulfate transporter [Moraxella equi]STZ04318.1 Probable sulfate transporter Rv1739c/MT1781 [Moraxella equi]